MRRTWICLGYLVAMAGNLPFITHTLNAAVFGFGAGLLFAELGDWWYER